LHFFNENEAEQEGWESRGILQSEELWKTGGFVETLYSENGESSPASRLAMLLGSGKYRSKQNMQHIFDECKANKDNLPVEAFNVAISRVEKKEGVEKGFSQVKNILKEMKDAGVNPNNATLIAILEVLAVMSRSKEYETCTKHALDVIAEFRVLGIEFSLGVYKTLIDIFVDQKNFHKSSILSDIMSELEVKSLTSIQHPQDLWFFPLAMKVCNQQNKVKLAWKVHDLLMTGDNLKVLNDFQKETVYYNNFVNVVLDNDEFQTAVELYNKLVPHTFCPMVKYYQSLLNHLHTNGALQHLSKIWDDIEASDYAASKKESQYMLTHQVMQILKANDPTLFDFTGLSEVWIDISRRVFNHLEENKSMKALYLRFNTLAPSICDLVISVTLREGDFELATRVIQFCKEEKTVMIKSLSNNVLNEYIEASVSLGEIDKAVDTVEYAVDVGSSEALKYGLILSKIELTNNQKDYLNKLFANNTNWMNI